MLQTSPRDLCPESKNNIYITTIQTITFLHIKDHYCGYFMKQNFSKNNGSSSAVESIRQHLTSN